MPIPKRTSIAMNKETEALLNDLMSTGESQSSIMRKALRFYYEFRKLEKRDLDRLTIYWDMLQSGEHVVLDMDHFIVLLRIAEGSEENKKVWNDIHTSVALNHAEQFRGMRVDQILERLVACNFFRYSPTGDGYVLVFGSQEAKHFIRTFLDVILKDLRFEYEIKEDLTKIRIRVK
uniref:CopG family transcriptional regulator n=1 Tax=Candidatus Methanomethylicus mesodigestus TaxID=1867258 RepID=A0A7C3EX17_9CREN